MDVAAQYGQPVGVGSGLRGDRGLLAVAAVGEQARVAGSLGSGAVPSSAPSMMAASVTLRAIGPAVS